MDTKGKIVLKNIVADNSTITQSPKRGGRVTPLSSDAYFDAKQKMFHHPSRASVREYTSQRNMQRASSSQSRRIRRDQPAKITVYADMLTVKYPAELNGRQDRRTDFAGGGIRGDIVGFSRASRKRMIEFMAKVRNVGDMYFVTMTYDDESWLVKPNAHQEDFEAFRRRFERAFPNWKAIWRVEVKERQSGQLIGQRVPHFHLLVFTGRNDSDEDKEAYSEGFRAWGVRVWGEILQAQNPAFEIYGFHVTPVRTRKHAYHYISKYIGKSENDDIACGRRWGRIGQFDTSSSETILLTDDEALAFRRLVKRWLRNRNPAYARSFKRQNSTAGFSIFGLGDVTETGCSRGFFAGYAQFIVEVKRQSAEREQRERGWSD